jgi:hypothetical protein
VVVFLAPRRSESWDQNHFSVAGRPYVEISGGGGGRSWSVGGLGNAHVTEVQSKPGGSLPGTPAGGPFGPLMKPVCETDLWAGTSGAAGRTATRSVHDPWRRPMERSREASREAAIEQLRSQRLKPEFTFHLPGFYSLIVPPASSQ